MTPRLWDTTPTTAKMDCSMNALLVEKSYNRHQTMNALNAHSSRQKVSKAERKPAVFPGPRDECKHPNTPSVSVVSRSMCVGTLTQGDELLEVDQLVRTENTKGTSCEFTSAAIEPDMNGQVHPVETPELIRSKLEDFDAEFKRHIEQHQENPCSCLFQATEKCPDLWTNEFKLQCLRWEAFNTKLAVQRYCEYWEEWVKVCCETGALEHHTLDNSSPKDIAELHNGMMQNLCGVTDPMGLAILYPLHARKDATKYTRKNIPCPSLPTDWEEIDNLSVSRKEEVTRSNTRRRALQELQQKFPKATAAECRRFHQANAKDAARKLGAYLAWREKYNLDVEQQSLEEDDDDDECTTETSKDLNDWIFAVQKVKSSMEGWTSHDDGKGQTKSMTEGSTLTSNDDIHTKQHAFGRSRKKEKNLRSDKFDAIRQLIIGPVVKETNETIRDLDGHRVFCHLPARIDLKAASYEAYAEILLLYIDSKQNRNNDEEFTLLVDVRPGPKWKNPPAITMLGFIRHVAHKVHDLSPGRLHRCIIYPVPYAAVYIWRLTLHFLNAQIRDHLVVIPVCASSSKSTTPTEALEKYLSKEALVCLEEACQQALLE